ncbi:MAG TPA: carbon starvation CstA family protein [Alphaproteobacteria bacterium]|nr:carbon starvation CstA family protein [Alphaproteobacteria bacterium]
MLLSKKIIWFGVAALGAVAFGLLAAGRGESVSAAWLVAAALCIYAIAYRFYSRFIADRVLRLDPARATPAVRLEDGLDYVPTNRFVLFGHHFAAIAGAGPLVGPVLAAQMGYLPGTLWILAGVVFAGAVQDFVVLAISTRRDGRSLGEIIRSEVGPLAGAVASVGIVMIMVILLAVLGLVVVKALAGSPWGAFTVFATIPIAFLMGVYGRYLRPGRVGEISLIGVVLLFLAIVFGRQVAEDPALAALFTFKGSTLALMLAGYGFVASVLPVWLILAPRDYLSTFLKIGTIAALAIGILFVLPDLRMPAVTRFIDGTGPVFSGQLFPFLFITVACGAVSGFHALVASGTTPKMVENETQIRFLGYGAMLMESAVAIMAMIAAGVIDPGLYFAMNSPAALIGSAADHAAGVISGWGFPVVGDTLTQAARDVGETTLLSRAGGAPTLAVGMADILSRALGGRAAMAYWYHFAILFEALFILTTLDAGTRVARFMLQDLVGAVVPAFARTGSWGANLAATALAVLAWGYFLYQGVVDPLGGINTLWPLFGIANQMLAAIALTACSVVLVKMKRERYLLVTLVPTLWLLVCTLTAGAEKLFDPDPAIGFLAHASKFAAALAEGRVLGPAASVAEMSRIVLNDRIDATLCGLFMAVVAATAILGFSAGRRAWVSPGPTCRESPEGDLALAMLQPEARHA